MKINIADPATGGQKLVVIEEELKYRIFFDKRISDEVPADSLGDEYKGYIFRITGGMDKQGFAMRQSVLTAQRVRLLLDGTSGHYRNRRRGDRRRKSVRGSICSEENAVINVVIVKKGETEIPGLTDVVHCHRLGPKRASNIRKFFCLTKKDNVLDYVVRRKIPAKDGKRARVKVPKVQRLVTPVTIRRKQRRYKLIAENQRKSKQARQDYIKLLNDLNIKKQAFNMYSSTKSKAVSSAPVESAQ